ncbi:protein of unknown function DUF1573 [Bacteroides coprosuis DSM 18011]|uniref:DUF1573 domain-containing protein n=1 Tax=Bacteroides coprosuis DSM 18011 TaxID=679937 RepID=F3ZU10_9BACE|nr:MULTISPECIES: DUF1573 domain-containing protein [Bacteroides]EGJ71111.1 protein of unknown function DUF1573 [Bacteroides coprosuis DSM 18011]HJD91313.1 DUF1573 domain-containing protein [Bacteroides coprosuis]
MKKLVLLSLLMIMSVGLINAQSKNADIKFEKTSQNLGTFSEKEPVATATYTFTNIGDAPLVIHQVVASCGCTVPEFSKEPVQPGKTGSIKVVYNGTDKPLGFFKKSIIVRSNAKTPTTRLFIEGTMTE